MARLERKASTRQGRRRRLSELRRRSEEYSLSNRRPLPASVANDQRTCLTTLTQA